MTGKCTPRPAQGIVKKCSPIWERISCLGPMFDLLVRENSPIWERLYEAERAPVLIVVHSSWVACLKVIMK